MINKYSTITAFRSIMARKTRSSLTVLGIVIGIAAIMLVMSAGAGAENLITGELSGLGAETVVVRPGKEPKGPTDFAATLFADSLKARELEALRKKVNVPDLIDSSPEVFAPGSVSYNGDTYKATVLGFSPRFLATSMGLELEEGVYFDDADVASKASVVILGSKVKDELFGTLDALGSYVSIKNHRFRVIGVYKPKGQVVFFNVDELALVPYTTAQTYLTGNNYYSQIVTKASSGATVDRMVLDIKRTLRDLHKIIPGEEDDFNIQTQQGLVDQVGTIINAFTLFLSLVVAVALVVGGVGVMNIMLVSVTERTREIGLRKALGATNSDIMYQFLIESVILTGAGGVIGILLGTILSLITAFAINTFTTFSWSFSFPVSGAIMGIVVSGLVGLIFGLYPARSASRKSPIEALRYE
ncbi:MAG TPA: ABC transporter permease [Candidatus Paceibacterota bacterium]